MHTKNKQKTHKSPIKSTQNDIEQLYTDTSSQQTPNIFFPSSTTITSPDVHPRVGKDPLVTNHVQDHFPQRRVVKDDLIEIEAAIDKGIKVERVDAVMLEEAAHREAIHLVVLVREAVHFARVDANLDEEELWGSQSASSRKHEACGAYLDSLLHLLVNASAGGV